MRQTAIAFLSVALAAGAQTLRQLELQPHRWGYLVVSIGPQWLSISPQEAVSLEQQLSTDPEDAEARAALLSYYWHNDMNQPRIESVCWLIEHHPESALLQLDTAWLIPGRKGVSKADLTRARGLWEAAINGYLSTEGLHNSARFFEEVDMGKAVALATRLQNSDPIVHTQPVANFFSVVLSGSLGSQTDQTRVATQEQLLSSLLQSTDASLVGTTAEEIIKHGSAGSCPVAAQLIARAQALEPQNRDWQELAQGTTSCTQSLRVPGGTVSVGPDVQAMKLLQSVAAIYPDLARQARIQGVVKVQVVVGADGRVLNVKLLSGHPLLAPAALEAVKQYVYSPTFVNGQPVQVTTEVDVLFQLE
jgi:TonB family protein